MALSTEKKAEILKEYGLHETDTGSPEAQVALLTSRINNLTEHLKDCLLYTSPSPRDS